MRAYLAALLLPLAACADEPENIQAKAENLSRALENKAVEIEAEANRSVDAAIAPLDNEAAALLGQAANSAEADGNGAAPPPAPAAPGDNAAR
jgi:hypothetical protein